MLVGGRPIATESGLLRLKLWGLVATYTKQRHAYCLGKADTEGLKVCRCEVFLKRIYFITNLRMYTFGQGYC